MQQKHDCNSVEKNKGMFPLELNQLRFQCSSRLNGISNELTVIFVCGNEWKVAIDNTNIYFYKIKHVHISFQTKLNWKMHVAVDETRNIINIQTKRKKESISLLLMIWDDFCSVIHFGSLFDARNIKQINAIRLLVRILSNPLIFDMWNLVRLLFAANEMEINAYSRYHKN